MLAIFHGPHAYVSPTLVRRRIRRCRHGTTRRCTPHGTRAPGGRGRAARARARASRATYEAGDEPPWRAVGPAGRLRLHRCSSAIVGFEIEVRTPRRQVQALAESPGRNPARDRRRLEASEAKARLAALMRACDRRAQRVKFRHETRKPPAGEDPSRSAVRASPQDLGEGRGGPADRSGAHPQRRHALRLPVGQRLLLPHGLPRARGGAGDGAGRQAAHDPLLPREEPRARDLGRLPLRSRDWRASMFALRRGLSHRRARPRLPDLIANQRRAAHARRRRRRVGRARHRLAQRRARQGAHRRDRARSQSATCAPR